jgi:DNA adenine methylase
MVGQNNFCDAFVGGGSVLLEVAKKYPKINLYANDKDSWVASFWQVVADNDTKNLDALLELVAVQPTLELFYKLRETPPNGIVEKAYRSIFFNRTTFSGIAYSGPIGGKEQKSKYSVDCRYNAIKLKKKILACHELLKGRTIVENVDILSYDILNNYDIPMYLDPPYYIKGDVLYIEKMNDFAHKSLSEILKDRLNWVLSYDDCPEIKSYYKEQIIVDLSARYCINGKKDNWENKNELIILPG